MKIGFIGGGNMSSCIINGILSTNNKDLEILIATPHPIKCEQFKDVCHTLCTNNIEVAENCDVLFLGVKPQVLPDVLTELSQGSENAKKCLIVSMAAAFSCKEIEKYLQNNRIIRIMPNTPAKIGLGTCGIFLYEGATSCDKEIITNILSPLGNNIFLQKEQDINVIAGVCGSAPAFIYRFMEALSDQAVKYGFSEEQARKMVEQVMLGTTSMVIQNQDTPISKLREEVTSKGGTTQAGLNIMTEFNFETMVDKTIEATLKRTNEIEQMFRS